MAPKQASSSKSKVPLFLVKTFQMIDDQTTDSTIMWNKAGDGFIVVEEHLCAQKILPRYFRHSNFSSFVRQLNFYGFKKGFHEGASCEFKHPKFKRGHKELLKDIRRKTSESHANQKKVMEDLQRDFDELKRRNDQLWQFQRKMLYTIATFVRANRNDATLGGPGVPGVGGGLDGGAPGGGVAGFLTSVVGLPEEADDDGVSAVSTFSHQQQQLRQQPQSPSSHHLEADNPQDAWDLCHQIEQLAEQMPPSDPGTNLLPAGAGSAASLSAASSSALTSASSAFASMGAAAAASAASEWAQTGPSKPPLLPQPVVVRSSSSRASDSSVGGVSLESVSPSASVSPGRRERSRSGHPSQSQSPPRRHHHHHHHHQSLHSTGRHSHAHSVPRQEATSHTTATARSRPTSDSPVVDFDEDDAPHIRVGGQPPTKRRRVAASVGGAQGALPSFGDPSSIQRDGFEEVTDDLDSTVPNPSLITPINAGFLSEDIGFPSSMFLSMPGNMPGALPTMDFAADFDSTQLLNSHLDMSDPFGISSPSLSMAKLPELPPSLAGGLAPPQASSSSAAAAAAAAAALAAVARKAS